MACTQCNSEAVFDLNPPDKVIFECLDCGARFHIHGVIVDNVRLEADSRCVSELPLDIRIKLFDRIGEDNV